MVWKSKALVLECVPRVYKDRPWENSQAHFGRRYVITRLELDGTKPCALTLTSPVSELNWTHEIFILGEFPKNWAFCICVCMYFMKCLFLQWNDLHSPLCWVSVLSSSWQQKWKNQRIQYWLVNLTNGWHRGLLLSFYTCVHVCVFMCVE